MFCPECGSKNEKYAKFCGECGAKIIDDSPKAKVIGPSNKKPMKKKTKIILAIIVIICASLIVFFGVGINKFKASSVAKEYFIALKDKDESKLYKYLDVKDSGFTIKKIFEKVYNGDKENIINYSVVEEAASADGLNALVTINYTKKGSSKKYSETISLFKEKSKKLFFFDNWKISNESSMLVENNKFNVPKNSELILEGIKVDKKYLKNSKNSEYDTYVIPELFIGKYSVKVILKNGLQLTENVKVDSVGANNLTDLKLDNSIEKTLEKDLPSIIEKLYGSAIEDKDFSEIKTDYEYEGANLDSFEESYNHFVDYLSDSLKEFKVTDIDIENIKVTSDGLLYVTVDVDYEYTLNYSFFGEEKNKTDESDDVMYLTFDYVKDNFKLVDISSMASYFSKY